MDAKKPDISLVDLIERERAALGPKQTRITLETFIAWKKRKIEERKEAQRKAEEKKRNEFRSGKNLGLSGREMFSFKPEMAMDGDEMDEGDEAFDLVREEEEEGEGNVFEYKDVDLETLGLGATEADTEGVSVAKEDRFAELRTQMEAEEKEDEEEGAAGGELQNGETGAINENLFLDEDLDGLDEELNDLDVDDTWRVVLSDIYEDIVMQGRNSSDYNAFLFSYWREF